jgi:hypothetical protein
MYWPFLNKVDSENKKKKKRKRGGTKIKKERKHESMNE